MARTFSEAMKEQLSAKRLRPAVFVELDFDNGPVRLWSGVGTIEWSGKQWTGAGYLLGLSPIDESANIEATGMSVSLSGVPSILLSQALGAFSQGRPARVYLGALSE